MGSGVLKGEQCRAGGRESGASLSFWHLVGEACGQVDDAAERSVEVPWACPRGRGTGGHTDVPPDARQRGRRLPVNLEGRHRSLEGAGKASRCGERRQTIGEGQLLEEVPGTQHRRVWPREGLCTPKSLGGREARVVPRVLLCVQAGDPRRGRGPGPLSLPGLGLMPGISIALQEEGGQEGQVAAEVPAAGLANVQRVRRAAVDVSGSVAQEEQGDWHVEQMAGHGGLVAAAAGVGARLARGEVFGSHAGGV